MIQKKIVLFIVEGDHDEDEINSILHTPYFADYLKHYRLEFKKVNTDITSDKFSSGSNIQGKLSQLVREFRKNGVPFSNIKVSDIDKIIHIVDTDGTFIPREKIKYADVGKYVYEEECIKANNPDEAYARNRRKASILQVLMGVKKIDNIKYTVYFVSCNMEHMLFDKKVYSPSEKSSLSDDFVKRCKNDPECLFENVFNKQITYDVSHEESWKDIQEGTNSLKRKTNINIFLEEMKNEEFCNE